MDGAPGCGPRPTRSAHGRRSSVVARSSHGMRRRRPVSPRGSYARAWRRRSAIRLLIGRWVRGLRCRATGRRSAPAGQGSVTRERPGFNGPVRRRSPPNTARAVLLPAIRPAETPQKACGWVVRPPRHLQPAPSAEALPPPRSRRGPCSSVSSDSSAHFKRAGLISMPSSCPAHPGESVSRPRSIGLPLISSVSIDALAWLIAQPRPVNATSATLPPPNSDHHRHAVAAERVGTFVADIRLLQYAEVVRVAGSAPGCRRGTDRPCDPSLS